MALLIISIPITNAIHRTTKAHSNGRNPNFHEAVSTSAATRSCIRQLFSLASAERIPRKAYLKERINRIIVQQKILRFKSATGTVSSENQSHPWMGGHCLPALNASRMALQYSGIVQAP